MKQLNLAEIYGHMFGLILSGYEFPAAHEETVAAYDLTDKQAKVLIAMYDAEQQAELR